MRKKRDEPTHSHTPRNARILAKFYFEYARARGGGQAFITRPTSLREKREKIKDSLRDKEYCS